MFCCICISTWKRNSVFMSRSRSSLRKSERRAYEIFPNICILRMKSIPRPPLPELTQSIGLGRLQYAIDGSRQSLPGFGFCGKLFTALASELVIVGLPVVICLVPLSYDQPLMLQPDQRRIKRALVDD